MSVTRHRIAVLACIMGVGVSLCFAQPGPTRYFYDDADQLFRVLDSTGTLIEYIYDPSGNVTAINRSTVAPGALSILNISPLTAGTGSNITTSGQNFSTTAANDIVMINGVAATVVSATATQLVVQVPAGVTAGQVTVTVNGVTASSGPTLVFLPLPVPVIDSVTPNGAVAGTTVNAAVTGANLLGASFSFMGGAMASATNVDPGTATLSVTALNTRGTFPLIATTAAGASTSSVTPANRFIVMISPDEADSQAFSVLNTASSISQGSDPTNLSDQANSAPVSVLNSAPSENPATDPTNLSDQANSAPISVLNTAQSENPATDPTNVSDEADSALVSLLNQMNSRSAMVRTASAIAAFASGSARRGEIGVMQSNSEDDVAGGQRLTIGIQAPPQTGEVWLRINGVALPVSRRLPHVFTFNAPAAPGRIAISAEARAVDGQVLASHEWTQSVVRDAGMALQGRVVDGSGSPVAGARVMAQASGLRVEVFRLPPDVAAVPDLAGRIPAGEALLAGPDWVNPENAFGPDPAGFGAGPTYAARYTGSLIVPGDGEYSFVLRARSSAQAFIDGQAVTGAVRLATGIHRLELTQFVNGDGAELQLRWIPPSGRESAIPQQSLVASHSALAAVTAADGSFTIAGVPARVSWVRAVVEMPDGRIGSSGWRPAENGSVADVGNVVVRNRQ